MTARGGCRVSKLDAVTLEQYCSHHTKNGKDCSYLTNKDEFGFDMESGIFWAISWNRDQNWANIQSPQ